MPMLTRLPTTGEGLPQYVDDVFSTYLYTGNSSAWTYVYNGIDLAGKGGLVWIKNRTGTSNTSNMVVDTVSNAALATNSTGTGLTNGGYSGLFSNGFGLNQSRYSNVTGQEYVSWTFRKAAKFFDVVTYTGDGTSLRAISHSLGSVPGLVIVKATSTTGNWFVAGLNASGTYYRTEASGVGALNASSALEGPFDLTGFSYLANTTFVPQTVAGGTIGSGNANGVSYVAYLFAHDTLASGLIQCGSYTGNGSANGPTITLGWEPQWLMIKRATGGTGNWNIFDNMRGMTVGGDDWYLEANTSDTEASANWITPTATGFQIVSTSTEVNNNTDTYIYMAIRRSNKPPTAGTQVFNLQASAVNGASVTGSISTSAANKVDTVIRAFRAGDSRNFEFFDRLRGFQSASGVSQDAYTSPRLSSSSPGNEVVASTDVYQRSGTTFGEDYIAFASATTSTINYALKRAPGFFDVVCYTGTGIAGTVSHSLGTAPEIFFVKTRGFGNWSVGTSLLGSFSGNYYSSVLDTTFSFSNAANFTVSGLGNSTLGLTNSASVNASATTYVAYLFASLAGISKVGTYTGNGGTVNTNGTSQTVNCGFSGGARFAMVKRTDSAGDWYIWDTVRGIVAGNDPYLLTNSTAAEVTGVDVVDQDNSGFIVNQTSGTNLNVTGATYLYLAIA